MKQQHENSIRRLALPQGVSRFIRIRRQAFGREEMNVQIGAQRFKELFGHFPNPVPFGKVSGQRRANGTVCAFAVAWQESAAKDSTFAESPKTPSRATRLLMRRTVQRRSF